ncbi:hypothetical protein METBIDRAFT_44141 [Metschnikowia bicuspidata var. bicuspidata NRRL YB-4993]|uniref:Efficient mitochondria targeting-associated protein 19 n=1 Tax=Metschnikowia bicuspidata var. bicuspidata NRRL YB-4993 TaxID=869754 RepID=A0A1A0H9H9_9ASCO|nr:hypothetical protein METBIDRAFT_44141 [Metschnikowia bicuspidata var. bicuspidata NRRL YB-4993]OBA20671.1 hypothetical protein METBIDRAFT_44141 [Metschnikowia bicuspidata var. bicuspidata NRRL YB-4993]
MIKRDRAYFWYFVLHIPITILIDSCLVIPREHRHWVQAWMVDFHVRLNKDFLLQNPPLWLQVFGVFELFFQLPVFFLAAYKLFRGRRKIHVMLVLYGFNASFTTLVCLVYVLKTALNHGLTDGEKWKLFALYLPYLLIPAFMMADSGSRLLLWMTRLHKLEAKRRVEKTQTKKVRKPMPRAH